MPVVHAEAVKAPKKNPTVTVEKSASANKTIVYQTSNPNIRVEAASREEAKVKLDAANGNVYALAINTDGVKRATGVVHVNGRTLLVADPEAYMARVAAKKKKAAEATAVAVATTTPATP